MKKTTKLLTIIFLSLFTILLTGCELSLTPSSSVPTKPTLTEPTPSESTSVSNGSITYINYDNDLYHEFFDINTVMEIKIDILEEELALIQSDYTKYSQMGSKSPIYRMADVTFTVNGTKYFYEEVGIRMKGNTSRRNFYNAEEGIYDLIHYKLAFNQTFDDEEYYANPKVWDQDQRKERKDRLFAGMSKLNIKWNKNFDETFLKERWAFEMFESYGVLAAKMTSSPLKLNYRNQDENMGVVMVIEDIDNSFLEKRLHQKHLGGDLYKVGWDNQYGGELTTRTIDRIGIEDEDISYFPIYDLKTNKKTSDFSLMKNLINVLNSNQSVESVVEINNYLTFEAISYLSGNPDDLRNHYNNHYIYFLNDSNLAIFIPHDYDRVFGITKDWNPTGDAMTSYSPYTRMTTMGGQNDQVNPLILKTIVKGSNVLYLEMYRDLILDMIASDYFDTNKFYESFNIIKNKYENDVYISITKVKKYESFFRRDEQHNMSFETYIQQKLNTINNRINDYK